MPVFESVGDAIDSRRELGRRVVRAVFGDRIGLAIFLGALAFFALYWRIGFFITDTITMANTLANVAEGRLAIEHLQYGLTAKALPGSHVVDGRLYGRNYGHVFFALPFLWLLRALSAVSDLRVAIAGGWSLLLLAFCVQVGTIVDRRKALTVIGSALAFGLFVASVLFTAPLDPKWLPMLALQLSTIVAGALIGVVCYRLLSRLHGRSVGAFAGATVVVATPIGFWAPLPKRHVVTALLGVLSLYWFASSRIGSGTGLRYRALAYVPVGLMAWIHPLEAVAFFAVLAAVDLSTAESNAPRELAGIGMALGVSLLPFFITNTLVGGNPVVPPRLLPGGEISLVPEAVDGGANGSAGQTSGDGGVEAGTGGSGDSEAATGAGGRSDGTATGRSSTGRVGVFSIFVLFQALVYSLGELFLSGVSALVERAEQLLSYVNVVQSLRIVTDEPARLYHTFVRSGRVPSIRYANVRQEPIDLTVLETMPILGVLAVLPMRVRDVHWTPGSLIDGVRRPARQIDAVAVGYAIVLTLYYLPFLPLHAQLTVRYLVPMFPMLVYGVARLSAVGRVVNSAGEWLAGAYVAVVSVGGIVLWAVLRWIDPAVGEAMQFHALVGLSAVGVLIAWSAWSRFVNDPDQRIGAAAIGLTMAVSTLFLLFTGLAYFQYGPYVLSLSEPLSEALSVIG